jgi:hypothetical protein
LTWICVRMCEVKKIRIAQSRLDPGGVPFLQTAS